MLPNEGKDISFVLFYLPAILTGLQSLLGSQQMQILMRLQLQAGNLRGPKQVNIC